MVTSVLDVNHVVAVVANIGNEIQDGCMLDRESQLEHREEWPNSFAIEYYVVCNSNVNPVPVTEGDLLNPQKAQLIDTLTQGETGSM